MSFETLYGFLLGIGVGFGAAAIWVVSSIIPEDSGECPLHKNQPTCAHRKKP